eukprot:746632-Hanusia_phi.AAC.3
MSRGQDGEGEEEEASDPPFRILCNKERVGQVLSLDRVYQHVRTDFVFHLEDDWTCDGRGGFIEESLEVLQENPSCFQVHLRHRKSMSHPVHPQLFLTSHSGVAYRRLLWPGLAEKGAHPFALSLGSSWLGTSGAGSVLCARRRRRGGEGVIHCAESGTVGSSAGGGGNGAHGGQRFEERGMGTTGVRGGARRGEVARGGGGRRRCRGRKVRGAIARETTRKKGEDAVGGAEVLRTSVRE